MPKPAAKPLTRQPERTATDPWPGDIEKLQNAVDASPASVHVDGTAAGTAPPPVLNTLSSKSPNKLEFPHINGAREDGGLATPYDVRKRR
ncbi:hypothetical protein CSOJ01_01009 [Colletotrichum sojae]|uniref:Uncharacterized protein n=1 Tax=Colletotrichum sojae TaxID=2175907 RepID=A0A8H6JWF4_9PEZI|nr:hypothetical protein CSOJ01_01009 [Colletotrichum sojae]